VSGPDYHQCTDLPLSARYGVLSGIGIGALLGGMLGSFGWCVYLVVTDERSWWAVVPLAAGVLIFVVTALIAVVVDEFRKARRVIDQTREGPP
jgi:Na+/proline symporter